MESLGIKAATILANIGLDRAGNWLKDKLKKNPPVEEMKKAIRVLFVDDEDFSTRLNTIRNAGWNVSQINDVTNFNSEEIKNADVVFMDYKGVGKVLTPTEEGIGLLKNLKKRYPEKFLVFFSGYAGFIPGHEFHSIADAWIDKHADSYIYIDQIEAAATEIYGKRKK